MCFFLLREYFDSIVCKRLFDDQWCSQWCSSSAENPKYFLYPPSLLTNGFTTQLHRRLPGVSHLIKGTRNCMHLVHACIKEPGLNRPPVLKKTCYREVYNFFKYQLCTEVLGLWQHYLSVCKAFWDVTQKLGVLSGGEYKSELCNLEF